MKIHFIGENGVSMRFLKRIAAQENEVSGSDAAVAAHCAENVRGADLVVYSSAIDKSNVEIEEAKRLGIPLCVRGKFLGEIMSRYPHSVAIAGAHGKTTTTAMFWKAFSFLDPTVHIGGRVEGKDGNIGKSEYFITEACEYEGNFLYLKAQVAVILNIDFDHPDCYKDEKELIEAFERFASGAETVLIGEDAAKKTKIKGAWIVGKGDNCNYRTKFCGEKTEIYFEGKKIGEYILNVPGEFNRTNAAFVIAYAHLRRLDICSAIEGLQKFCGAERRLEILGKIGDSTVITDYAHHPCEITAILHELKNEYGKVLAIFEPHTYSRTILFANEFADALKLADEAYVLPIFAAREKYDGHDSATIFGSKFRLLTNYVEAIEVIESRGAEFAAVVMLGAGNFDGAARSIFKHLDKK